MIGRISVAAIAIFIGACASSGPEAPAPAVTASSASVDAVASDQPAAPPAGVIYDLDAPDVAKTASAWPASKSDEIVCRRESQPGGKMTVRVCRSRAEMEATAAEAQEALRQMRSPRTGSACDMTGDC